MCTVSVMLEIHTADPNLADVEIAIAKFKTSESSGSDKILEELIRTEDETILRSINSLNVCVCVVLSRCG
jgi:hypothetical protein